ncbi:hypothetical protein CYMTET_27673 [Cymbomonas tetramitiformis]|uniref:Polymorphic outer membrane protein n=1 Tax=Cymbomonas tetramitiformis TaxID=36881 RepID=A0AAE0KWY8_9CHLO|nr:hypothetical protein CYMTET_27673 [Cymbomonas tetramitiformis]
MCGILARAMPHVRHPDACNVLFGFTGIHLLDDGKLVAGEGCALRANVAKFSGGNLGARNSRVELSGTSLLMGASDGQGGGAMLEQSAVTMRGGDVTACHSNSGGGGIEVDSSIASFENVNFSSNIAGMENGGGLRAGADSAVVISASVIQGNGAEVYGGGLFVDSGATLNCTDSLFIGNSAGDGAGVAVSSSAGLVALENATFGGGVAQQGGGVYLHAAIDTPLHALLWLRFRSNDAAVGENIFWEPLDDVTPAPQLCIACAHPAGTLLVQTTATDFMITQGGMPLGAGGALGTSGMPFDPPLMYVAMDYYGHITTLPTSIGVTVSASTAALSLSGATHVLYDPLMGAIFDELVLHGAPGGRFELLFRPQSTTLNTWAQVMLPLTLAVCDTGHVYEAPDGCTPCPAGSIKFSNDSAPCTLCGEGLLCSGRSTYEVANGYWLAPNAKYCEEDVACFLERLYSCPQEEACTTTETPGDGRRGGNSSAAAATLELCSTQAYAGGVLCGGGEHVVCSSSYYAIKAGTECTTCPSMSELIGWALGVIIVFCTILLIFIRYGDVDMWIEIGMTDSTVFDVPSAATSQLLGYYQVLSQMNSIYRADLIPEPVRVFVESITFLHFDLAALLNVNCIHARLAPGTTLHEFWLVLLNAMALPWILMIIGVLYYQDTFMKCLSRRTRERMLAIILFILVLIHPAVGTSMFEASSPPTTAHQPGKQSAGGCGSEPLLPESKAGWSCP